MYHYQSNTVRWTKHNGEGDVRSYCPPKGWSATADLIEIHPITGESLGESQWWIMETKDSEETQDSEEFSSGLVTELRDALQAFVDDIEGRFGEVPEDCDAYHAAKALLAKLPQMSSDEAKEG